MLAMTDYREITRQKALKREASLAKTGAPITYQFGADVVTLTKQPMEYDHTNRDGTKSGPKFKSKYKVELNGTYRGDIVSLNGWGSDWVVLRLDDRDYSYYNSYRAVVAKFGGAAGRDKLAEKIPTLYRDGQLGTLEEQAETARLLAIKKQQDEEEAEARREQWRRERVAENQQLLAELRDREATLRSLLDRQVLTNYESEIVSQMVAELAPKIAERIRRLSQDGVEG